MNGIVNNFFIDWRYVYAQIVSKQPVILRVFAEPY